jgi:hypothetical protein
VRLWRFFSWQAATVHFNYSGNWTALFMTGELYPPPPELAAHTYTFPASTGFDGQFYRYVAHAPWFGADSFRAGWARYFDSPRLRYERILSRRWRGSWRRETAGSWTALISE